MLLKNHLNQRDLFITPFAKEDKINKDTNAYGGLATLES
jgi:hypothetical protein